MKIKVLIILSVILWFYGHSEPVIFPDGDALTLEMATRFTYDGKMQLIKVVTVYDGKEVLYRCNLADVSAMKLCYNVL